MALVALLGTGSIGLWTVVPIGWLWVASSLSHNYVTIYLIALVGCPLMMVLWGLGLYRINAVYLRISGGGPTGQRTRWPAATRKRPAMMLDLMLAASALLAVIALFVWFFFFAGSPTSTPIPDEFSGQGQ